MCLPQGRDMYGRDLHVEVLDIGIKEHFSGSDFLNAVPVTIEHNEDKMKVTWGHSGNATWVKLGKRYVDGGKTIAAHTQPLGSKALSSHAETEPLTQLSKEPLVSTGPAVAPVARTFFGNIKEAMRKGPKALPRLEAHIPGSLYDPYGTLPFPKSGFRIASNNSGCQQVWWASTILVSKDKPGEPYFLVLRHTLYSLQLALDRDIALQVVSDHTGATVGFLGTDFPMPQASEGKSLVNKLPARLKAAFEERMKLGLIPPEPAMLYDLLLVPCKWNLSKAGLRSAKSSFCSAIGHNMHMRAFDFENPQHNGVTCGRVPDTQEARDMVKTCGVVPHQVANSHGGSGSFGWEGDSIGLLHMGCKGDNLNYGVPGPVLRQLERYWLGHEPIKSSDKGYQRFLKEANQRYDSTAKIMEHVDLYCPPELAAPGGVAQEPLADKIAGVWCEGLLEAPFQAVASSQTGSKRNNAYRFATGQALRRLARMDYNKTREMVKQYKVTTGAGNSTMAMLYYWMEHGDEEEYNYRYTGDEDFDDQRDEGLMEYEFQEWINDMMYGDAPIPEQLSDHTGSQEQPKSDAAPASAPEALAPGLHAPRLISIPDARAMSGPLQVPARRPALESPLRELTISQVSEAALDVGVPTYASRVEDCSSTMVVDARECAEFDALCDGFLKSPECLRTTTMTELSRRCSEHNFKGALCDSTYWRLYIAPNVVPGESTLGARKIANTTAKAKCQCNGSSKKLVEPSFDGLHAKFPEWNWDQARNQARGVLPPEGPKHVADSLDGQLHSRDHLAGLDPRTVPLLARGYPAHVWDQEETVYQCIHRHFDALIMEKGVGWHLRPGIKTKRAYVESPDCIPATVVKLLMLLTTSEEWLGQAAPWHLYQAGFIMPEVLKIKSEAHKRSKADTKRWRLIWQTCITQEVLSRLIQGDQNQAEVAAYQAGYTHTEDFPTFGNAAGMGHHDEGLEHTREAFKRLLGTHGGCAADRKAWDMSISRHAWIGDGRLRAILSTAGGAPRVFARAQVKMCMLLSAHVVQIGHYLYQVDTFGLVGSGILSTASSNGHINQLVTLDCGVTKLPEDQHSVSWKDVAAYLSLVMGDDSVMRECPADVAGFVAHHRALGIEVTGTEKDTAPGPIADMGKVSFTSHDYDLRSDEAPAGVFTNVEKLAWRIAAKRSVTKEQAMGVLFAVRHSPHKEVVRDMLVEANPALKDIQYVAGAGYTLDTFL